MPNRAPPGFHLLTTISAVSEYISGASGGFASAMVQKNDPPSTAGKACSLEMALVSMYAARINRGD
jgi:hypothetical protein